MQRLLLLAALLVAFCACSLASLSPVICLPRDVETTGRYIAVLREDTSHQRLLEIVESLRNLSDGCKVLGYMAVAMKGIVLDLSLNALQQVCVYQVLYCAVFHMLSTLSA